MRKIMNISLMISMNIELFISLIPNNFRIDSHFIIIKFNSDLSDIVPEIFSKKQHNIVELPELLMVS